MTDAPLGLVPDMSVFYLSVELDARMAGLNWAMTRGVGELGAS
jgi:hypothetical protein